MKLVDLVAKYLDRSAEPVKHSRKRIVRIEFEMDGGLRQEIDLNLTKMNLGTVRLRFLCPSCGCRVGTLDLPQNGKQFACRHCYRLHNEVRAKHRTPKRTRRLKARTKRRKSARSNL